LGECDGCLKREEQKRKEKKTEKLKVLFEVYVSVVCFVFQSFMSSLTTSQEEKARFVKI